MLTLLLAAAATAPPPPSRFLHVDSRRRSAQVTLVAAYDGTNNGFNFDGYSRTLLWTVPLGWRIHVTCTNRGPLRHSCAVVRGAEATRPAFARAETASPFTGLEAGRSASFSFRASRVGVFRFADLVPGHEAARMYVVLEVVRSGRPSVQSLTAPG